MGVVGGCDHAFPVCLSLITGIKTRLGTTSCWLTFFLSTWSRYFRSPLVAFVAAPLGKQACLLFRDSEHLYDL